MFLNFGGASYLAKVFLYVIISNKFFKLCSKGECNMKLLLVVDMQNDFVDGALGFPNSTDIIKPICEKIKEYSDAGHDVYFTKDMHDNDYPNTQEGRKLPIAHCISQTTGSEIIPQLQQYTNSSNVLIKKNCFGSIELGEFLKSKKYSAIEICGLVSNICVLFAAVISKAALPEVEVTIDESCTASYDEQLHTKTLDVLAGCQFNIIRK